MYSDGGIEVWEAGFGIGKAGEYMEVLWFAGIRTSDIVFLDLRDAESAYSEFLPVGSNTPSWSLREDLGYGRECVHRANSL